MNKKLVTVMAVVALAVLVGVGYLLMNKADTDDSSSTNTSQQSSEAKKDTTSADTKSSKSNAINDACKVFTASDLSGALGTTFAEGSSDGYTVVTNSDGLPQVQCDWEENGGDDPAEYTVHLDVYNFANEANAKTDMDNSRVTGGNLSNEDISGVADDAMYARSGSGPKYVQGSIYWRSGSTVYHLSAVKIGGVDRPALEASLKQLVDSKF